MTSESFVWNLSELSLTTSKVTRLYSTTLSVPSGVTAVIGYSGAGKTSLLNLLAKLERPTSGTISFNAPTAFHRLPLYWVPQDGGLWPHLSVREHLNVVRAGNFSRAFETQESADKLLTQFDLLHRQHAFPGELSQGERSRLAVARGIAAEPAVLIMDEPLSHVDPARHPAYWDHIREHIQQNHTSLIFSTHEPATALRESQSVICLNAGRVQFCGNTMTLYTQPPSAEVGRFLGALNWFTRNDAMEWLNSTDSVEMALRPEQIRLVADEEGSCEILSFRFGGSYAETVVRDSTSEATRTIFHRPASTGHHPGQRVHIEVVL